ncbi:MAG: plastocyanin/azurin family copper-binding protein [Dehalococcoidia bacterium]
MQTERGEPFDSGNIDLEGTFRHAFEAPGTYRYFCIPHEGAAMAGEVVVKPAPDSRHAPSVCGGAYLHFGLGVPLQDTSALHQERNRGFIRFSC